VPRCDSSSFSGSGGSEISVAEPHHFDAAPVPGSNFDAAPAPVPTLLYSMPTFRKRTKVNHRILCPLNFV
jgi:hypothetical protein